MSAVQVDPVAAALRSDAARYDALLIGAVALLAGLALRRLAGLGLARALAAAAVTAVALGLGFVVGVLLYWGVALAILVGIVITFGRQQGWLPGWRLEQAKDSSQGRSWARQTSPVTVSHAHRIRPIATILP